MWHSWHNQSQSSSKFLNKQTSRVTFHAIQKTTQRFTIPYLREKWGCPKDEEPFRFQHCNLTAPWGGEKSIKHWVPPTEALQKEKLDFLLAESAKS